MSRDKGSGSIYQDARGKWRAAVEVGYNPDGSRRRATITARTKTEAQVKLKAKLRQIAETGAPADGAATMTVKRFADEWIARRATELRPKTQMRDEGVVSNWIIPTIGHRRLSMLTPADIRSVSSAILRSDRSAASARRAHSALMKLLKDAAIDGYPVPPRVLLVSAPPKPNNDREGLAVDQAVAVLRTARNDPDASRWVAALLQGMRQGECLGLTWSAVDLKRDTIDVSWQLQSMPFIHGCDGCGRKRAGDCPQRRFKIPIGYEVRPMYGAWCLVRPKTAHGQRLIPVIPWMHEALIRHGYETARGSDTLVWPGAAGNPRTPREDLAAWHDLQARAGVAHPSGRPYHVHEARHSTATLLMELKIPESVRIAIMGHSQAATTRLYEHASLDQARKALEQIAGKLGLD